MSLVTHLSDGVLALRLSRPQRLNALTLTPALALMQSPKPVLGAVQGWAVGAGGVAALLPRLVGLVMLD